MAKTLRTLLNDADTILLGVAERLEELMENADARGNSWRVEDYGSLASTAHDLRDALLRLIDKIPARVR